MDSLIERIKAATPVLDLIGQTFTIIGHGSVLTTVEHDSLKIWKETNSWYWFSKGMGGDVLDWYQHIHRCDLATAIEHLARAAHIERRPLTPEEQAERAESQQRRRILHLAADHYHNLLLHHPAGQTAIQYTSSRGWTLETLRAEMIGCTLPAHASVEPVETTPTDNSALSPDDQPLPRSGGGWEGVPLDAQLRAEHLLDHPTAKAVLSIPPDMLVYVHRRGGQVVYLSARSLTGKRHYNLPEKLAGPKQPYTNSTQKGWAVLVEGQADAISLAQLDIPAEALCGTDLPSPDGRGAGGEGPGVDLPSPIGRGAGGEGPGVNLAHITHIGLDADEAGRKRALAIAAALNPLLPIVDWGRKDANAMLVDGADRKLIFRKLEEAKPALLHLAAAARKLTGDPRTQAHRQVLDAWLSLDELVAADLRPDFARTLGVGVSQLNNMLAARRKEVEAEKPSPDRYEYSAGGARGGYVWEQCVTFQPDGSAAATYAVRDPKGKIEIKPMLDVGNVTYTPYPANSGIIDARVVLFPEKPAPYGDQRQLVRRIQAYIHRYLDIDPFYERLAAYYVLFSWVYDMFENLPYLRAIGDYGTGKTRFLQAIGVLCYRPMFVSGASSVSPVFRLIDMFRGTLIIDEADFANSDADAEIVKILNVGYYRTGIVLRSEKDPATNADNWSPQVFRVFGPKLLATRKPFTDRATESRCLTRRMTSARPRPDISYILGPEFWAEATELRNQLLQYRLEKWRANVEVDPALADDSVEPRLNQVTMALKSIVDDPEMRGEIDSFIRAYNETMISDRQMSLPALVVQALSEIHYSKKVDLMGDDARDFTMKGLADATRAITLEIDPDIKIHPRTISKLLSEDLGLPRRRTCPRTRRAALEYADDELAALMQRYGIEPPPGVESIKTEAEKANSEGCEGCEG